MNKDNFHIKSEFIVTRSFKKHRISFDKNYFTISQGGRGSGKTYSILQLLILYCLRNSNENKIISIVAATMPMLKRGAIRDFKDLMIKLNLWQNKDWNKSESIYNLFGNTIEFFSIEDEGRARGPARSVLYINECNLLSYETAFQLISRTQEKVVIDFNPVAEFWAHTEILQNENFKGKIGFLKTNFTDNGELPQSIVDAIIARAKKDENYKRVYVLGEIGNIDGLIFNNFEEINNIPNEIKEKASIQYFGMDWGYSNDPTTIIEVYILGDRTNPVQKIYINELFYSPLESLRPNNPAKEMARIIKEQTNGRYQVICDNSDLNLKDDVQSFGINIEPFNKPAGSVNFGIEIMKDADIYITKNSINTLKEFRQYVYSKDRQGQIKRDSKNNPKPIGIWNHSIDAIRYVALTEHANKYQDKILTSKPAVESGGLVAF